MTVPRAAAVAEVGWSTAGSLDWSGFLARLPEQMHRYEMVGIHPSTAALQAASQDASQFAPQVAPQAASRGASLAANAPGLEHSSYQLSSHQLKSCTDKVVLSLEDDAPLEGKRATFLVDIMNPCWIYPAVDLTSVKGLVAAVGQLPFNFQLGADIHAIKLNRPQTPSGELEIRIDSCDGERIAVLPLQPAIVNNAVTELPAAKVAHRDGTHDLCLKFTQRSLDPMWVLDWVRLE
jgi:hexosaminidase